MSAGRKSKLFLGLGGLERDQERLLFSVAKRAVGESEEDIVFLVDVFAEQGNVAFGMFNELLQGGRFARGSDGDVLVHAADVRAALVVFVEHDAGWPAFARKTLGFQRGE